MTDLDPTALAEACRRERERHLAASPARRLWIWFLTLAPMAVTVIVLVPIIAGDTAGAYDPHGRRLWFRVALALVACAFLGAFNRRQAAKNDSDPAAAASRMAKEIAQLTEPGWVTRVVRNGAKMGLAIGLPVGLLLALLPLPDYSGFRDRAISFAVFVGLTFLWTIPMAFAIRWLSIRSLRRLS